MMKDDSEMCSFVWTRMTLSIVQYNTLILQYPVTKRKQSTSTLICWMGQLWNCWCFVRGRQIGLKGAEIATLGEE